MKILIDPGHGPGNANRGPNGYREYAGMWILSNHLKDILTAKGAEVKLTRKEHENPTLLLRASTASRSDLFISEHSNASNGFARGVECFYGLTQPQNRVTASKLAEEVSKVMQNPNRGAKTKRGNNGLDHFGVIRSAVAVGCPRVFLIENGFHDNPEDEAFLLQSENLKRIAAVQADVIVNTLNATQLTAKPSPWAAEAWSWAIDKQITDGTNPQGMPTREQVVQLIYNAAKKENDWWC